jgi:biuret amidohydrolase
LADLDLNPLRSALLVIDMEHDFVDGPMAVDGAQALATRLAPFVAAARAAGVAIVFVTQALRTGDAGPLDRFDAVRERRALVDGSPGVEVVPDLNPAPGDLHVVKRRFSAFFGTDLDLILRSRDIRHVIVCGISAHICCDTTVRDAFQHGYDPIYVVDGVEMGDLPDAGWGRVAAEDAKRTIATILAHRFAQAATIEDILPLLAASVSAQD